MAAASAVPAGPATRDWPRALLSRDLYPLLVALRERREPGSLAAVRQLNQACVQAQFALNVADSNPSLYGAAGLEVRRLQARQEIELRCGRLWAAAALDLSTPLPDDAAGLRYAQAQDVLGRWPVKAEAAEIAFREIAAQGHFHTLSSWIERSMRWRGVSWQHEPAVFKAAVALAAERATWNPGAGPQDLRVLTQCFRQGRCEGADPSPPARYEDQPLDAAQQARIETLAQDMLSAFRANDVQAWLGPAVGR